MRVAKLSDGRIVQLLNISTVAFATGTHALVCPQLKDLKAWSNNPYWVPSAMVVWVLEFN